MTKYNSIHLKKVKARKKHTCLKCGREINIGEEYYNQRDRFLQVPNPKIFCAECYKKYGEKKLIQEKTQAKHKDLKKW